MINHGHLYEVNIPKYKTDYIPLKEYPRPYLKRDNYLILNGYWDFMMSKDNSLPNNKFTKKILVPFAVETPISGIHQLVEPDDYLIYERKVNLPKSMKGKKILIHFEGIDQVADVYVDKKLVHHHEGIASFVVPIDYLNSFTLSVVINDKTDLSYFARGKQTLDPQTYLYSSSSGIIKTVWLEVVNDNYIEEVIFEPLFNEKSVNVFVKTKKSIKIDCFINKDKYEIISNKVCKIKLSKFHPWSALDPFLYNVILKSNCETISSYFGIRKIETKIINKQNRILINDKPTFFSGVLNQGYYFLGDLTPTSHQDYIDDIKRMKSLGFNTLRVHAKIEDPLFYYYCDKLGMYVIQDFVNGGSRYDPMMIYLPRLHRRWDYHHLSLKGAGRDSKISQNKFYEEMDFYLKHFAYYPSVIIYTIFNEAWGEFNPNECYAYCKKKDQYHLFDTASGWLDADSDFYSVHTYSFPRMRRKDKRHRPIIYTEIGGIGLRIDNHSYFDGLFAHKTCYTSKQYQKKLSYLFTSAMKYQIKHLGLNMVIYTQLADCETEYNGLYTFDRKILKISNVHMLHFNKVMLDTFNKKINVK